MNAPERQVESWSARRFAGRAAALLVVLGATGAAALYLIRQWPDARALDFDAWIAAAVIPLTIAAQWSIARATRPLCDRPMSPLALPAVVFGAGFVNLVAPARLGAVYRTVMTSRVAGVTLAAAIGITLVVGVWSIGASGLVAGAAVVFVQGQVDPRLLAAIVAAPLAAAGVAIALGATTHTNADSGWRSRVAALGAASRTLLRRPLRAIGVAMALVASNVAGALSVFASYAAIGAPIDFATACLILPAASLSTLVAITPGGLGTREAMMLGLGTALGVPPSAAAAAAILERLFASATQVAIGLPSVLWLGGGKR